MMVFGYWAMGHKIFKLKEGWSGQHLPELKF